ncbi:Hpt domain-containing protein [Polaromonas sp.]|uniref:Hpt domain-containing protein n=1 Tax=Polaromonas sp. TaxID=1869339 RepID=UPI002488399E|nr:Hpt domain-containing protein [Polaromonas sp.]MDI1272907.1 Hpt domain-containing protein [Polaromonas sp.]
MSTPQQDFQKFLDQQRADYRRALPEKIAHIRSLWNAVASGDETAPRAELERLVHTLAGTAGTLGFHAVGAAAKALELLLEQASSAGQVRLSPRCADIALAVAALQASLPADEPLP